MTEKSHTEAVMDGLALIDEKSKLAIKLAHSMLTDTPSLYPVDLLAIGAVKRLLSTSSGFSALIKSWNMTCARSVLRMHIDTFLRFSAINLVEKPHDLAQKVRNGEHISNIKDKTGKKMTDKYLVEQLLCEYPWLNEVYDNLCGYVHFSNQHILSSAQNMRDDDDEYTIYFEIAEDDGKYPEKSWIEIIACFNESTDIFFKYLKGWINTKRAPTGVSLHRVPG